MKICIINNLYPPLARGGAEQVVEKTVEALIQNGHEIVLITLGSGAMGTHQVTKELGCTIYQYAPRNLFFYTDSHTHSFFARFVWHLIDMFHRGSRQFVRSVLKKELPDVVHTHNLMGLGFLIPGVIRALGIRHIHTVHDVQLVEPSGIILKQQELSFRYTGFPTKIYVRLMRILMGSPRVVISPSNFLRDFYTQWQFFPESTFVQLRNPMTFVAGDRDSSKPHANVPFRFYYVGQIEDHKGVPFLVQTFLQFEETQCELHIVGDGSAIEEIKRMAATDPRVHIHGRVSRKDLPALFEQADVVVVPSLCYENSPTVIFESFAFGVPVLASNIEGIAELIQEKQNGVTFSAGDQKELINAFTWCVSHTAALQAMAYGTVQTLPTFSLTEYVETLSRYYRS